MADGDSFVVTPNSEAKPVYGFRKALMLGLCVLGGWVILGAFVLGFYLLLGAVGL